MTFFAALARLLSGRQATTRPRVVVPDGPRATPPPTIPASWSPLLIVGPAKPTPRESFMSVRGESFHQDALRALVPAGQAVDFFRFTATLKPEPESKFDPNSIIVLGPGAQALGHLPKHVAKQFQRQLLTLGSIDCPAELRGGDSARQAIGVVLHWGAVGHALSAIKVPRRPRVTKPAA